jgi:DeoR/GlpR family transcriptional regulator of sugar metabolism
MIKSERHQLILDRVEKNGIVITKELVTELKVAEDTIRKDFQELSSKGLVRRVHGGVLKIENKISNFDDRVNKDLSLKEKLCFKTFPLIENEKVIFIDGSTTNLVLAKMLPMSYQGMVITNSPSIALALCNHDKIDINVIGGNLNPNSKVISGSSSIQQIRNLNVECTVLGISSLSIEGGITYPFYEESIMKSELIKHSNKLIVIASKNKFNRIATFKAGDIDNIDYIITDENEESILYKYKEKGLKIINII